MDDDRALYRRWLDRRDAGAFATLVRRHADLVHDVAWRVSGDRDAAEDALQEALVRLAADGTGRPAEIGVRSWLARVAIDRARNARRSDRARGRRERKVGAPGEEGIVDVHPVADEATVRGVDAALSRADPEDAALLTLRYRHGVEYAELATILDVSEPTLRVRVHRAISALRNDPALAPHDEPRIERALAAVPFLSCSTACFESAVSIAVGGAGVGTTTGALATAASVGARAGGHGLRSVIAVVGALVVIGGLFVVPRRFRDSSDGRDPRPNVPMASTTSPDDAGSSDLAAPPRAVASSNRSDPAPGAVSAPVAGAAHGPVPRPAPSVSAPGQELVHTIRVRAELIEPGARGIPIPVDRVNVQGQEWPGSVAETDGLRVLLLRGGRVAVNVKSADPRALLPWARVFAQEPAPETLVARFPTASDPRFDPLVIEVVDASSGVPVAGAMLEWQHPGTRPPTETTGVSGRITVARVAKSGTDSESGVRALMTRGFTIHAAGFRSSSQFAWGGSPEAVVAESPLGVPLNSADWDSFVERGVWPVRLRRATEDEETKSVRVLFHDGRPALGAVVYVTYVAPARLVKALGATIGPDDASDGLRRVGADGRIEFAARTRTALEIFLDGFPVGVFALSGDRWPLSGPREVRLAPIADVTIALDGVPDGKEFGWMFDPLGAARAPQDGSIEPVTWDDGYDAKSREGEFTVFTFLGNRDPYGALRPGRNEIRFRFPVGWSRPLYVASNGESRHLLVTASHDGPVRIDANWSDLAIDVTPDGRLPATEIVPAPPK